MDDLQFYITIVVSTAHMSESDRDILNGITTHTPTEGLNLFTTDEYSYRIYVPSEDAQHIDDLVEQALQAGFSDAMAGLLRLASAHGCKILELDCDGPVISGLQTFDW